jgi:hypothetical protein
MAIQFTNYQLFIDPVAQVAYQSYGDFAPVPTPVFTQGDKVRLELYVVQQTNVPGSLMQLLTFPSGTVKVQVGTPGVEQVVGTSSSTAVAAPAITLSAGAGGVTPFTIGPRAFRGFFNIRIQNTSPALDVTTRFIQYPIDINLMQTALTDAVLKDSDWEDAESEVLQTGELTGSIALRATETTTVYDLANASQLSVTSSLTGYPGKYVDLDFSAAAVATFLGSSETKAATLEVQISDSGDVQTYVQLACTIRKQVLDPA